MKSFNTIYESVIKTIMNEGGNAFKNVSRIKQKLINKVFSNFKKNVIDEVLGFDVKEDDIFLLGSTGKKPDSGDIDIGINANIFKESILISLMKFNERCAELGYPSYINTINFKMLHVNFPQSKTANVQIDLLLTKYPEFTKFFMFSPTLDESRYKGAHRNNLLHSIMFVTSMKPLQYDNDRNLVKWETIDIDDDGLFKITKTLIDENGERLLYKNTTEPLEFNYAKNEKMIPISHDVDYVIKTFIGDYKVSDIDTFEKLFEIISNDDNFKFKDKKDEILRNCAKTTKENDRLEFPKELEQYL